LKAIILSGGAGTRLAPISTKSPKPMAMLPGAPVLEYLIKHLKKHGITDISLAVCHLWEQIEEYFSNGERFGVKLHYVREEKPLGTAGAARMCMDDNEEENILVLPGDAVCDFDLTKCIATHEERKTDAAILLSRCREVRQYGLVMCGKNSMVLRFVEKPSWAQITGSLVNTGIYILSPKVLASVNRGEKADFALDVFPRMLSEGSKILGLECSGYWRDIGSCEAYHSACMDIIAGKTGLECPPTQEKIEGVRIVSPSYIGPGCRIGKGSIIGPLACIQPGSIIGDNCRIERSVICAAGIGENTKIQGAVICSGAKVGNLCTVGEGCVIGDGAVIENRSLVWDNVKVWPGRSASSGSVLRTNLVFSDHTGPCTFQSAGILKKNASAGMDAPFFAQLGSVLAASSPLGVGCSAFDYAACLRDALVSGARAAGARVYITDAQNAAALETAALIHGFEKGVFIDQRGDEISINICGKLGSPLTKSEERSIETALRRGEWPQTDPRSAGSVSHIQGIATAHARAALDSAGGEGAGQIRLCSYETGSCLKELLTMAGAKSQSSAPGVPCMRLSRSGRGLLLYPGGDKELKPYHTRLLALRLLLDRGFKEIASHPLAPAAFEEMAASEGARLIMPGEEGFCDAMKQSRALLDGVYCASLILRATAKTHLNQLLERMPKFYTAGENISLAGYASDLMELLSHRFAENASFENGILAKDSRGWVRITPLPGLKSLHIAAETHSFEAARELCGDIKSLISRLDSECKNGGAGSRSPENSCTNPL